MRDLIEKIENVFKTATDYDGKPLQVTVVKPAEAPKTFRNVFRKHSETVLIYSRKPLPDKLNLRLFLALPSSLVRIVDRFFFIWVGYLPKGDWSYMSRSRDKRIH